MTARNGPGPAGRTMQPASAQPLLWNVTSWAGGGEAGGASEAAWHRLDTSAIAAIARVANLVRDLRVIDISSLNLGGGPADGRDTASPATLWQNRAKANIAPTAGVARNKFGGCDEVLALCLAGGRSRRAAGRCMGADRPALLARNA